MRRHVIWSKFTDVSEEYNYLHLQMLRPFSETFLNFCRLHGVMSQKTSTVHGKCRQDLEPYILFITIVAIAFPVQRIAAVCRA